MGQNTFRIFKPSRKRMKQIQEGIQRKRDRQATRASGKVISEREHTLARIAKLDAEIAARRDARRKPPREKSQDPTSARYNRQVSTD